MRAPINRFIAEFFLFEVFGVLPTGMLRKASDFELQKADPKHSYYWALIKLEILSTTQQNYRATERPIQ